MTIYEGVSALKQGKSIRRKTWQDPHSHIRLNKDPQGFSMLDCFELVNVGEETRKWEPLPFDFDGDIWELYEVK